MFVRHGRETIASAMGQRLTPGTWITPRAWRAVALILVVMVMIGAGQMAGAGARQQDDPALATPGASPVASPAASPIAEYPTTQIIVGKITIDMNANGFGPTYFESAVGRDITITVVNRDDVPHNFTIEKLEIDVDVQPGDEAVVEIEQPPLGSYEFHSDLPGDEDMTGAFSVFI